MIDMIPLLSPQENYQTHHGFFFFLALFLVVRAPFGGTIRRFVFPCGDEALMVLLRYVSSRFIRLRWRSDD